MNIINKKIKKIGIATPSSKISDSIPRLDRAIAILKELHYDVILGELSESDYYYAAGSIDDRINEINQLIRSDVDVIMFSIGGLTSVSILHGIDYQSLKDHNKIFFGNSDITAILLAVYTISHSPAFYFQTVLPAFGELGWTLDENIKYFKEILCCKPPHQYKQPLFWTDDWKNWIKFESEKTKKNNKWIIWQRGECRGKMLGGNLQTIVKLIGSKYMPNFDKAILFLEDTSVSAEMTESAIAILKNSGIIDNIAGLIVGKCENYNAQGMSQSYGEWVATLIDKQHIPILIDFDCGHTYPAIPLLIGATYSLDCISKNIPILQLEDYDSLFKENNYEN